MIKIKNTSKKKVKVMIPLTSLIDFTIIEGIFQTQKKENTNRSFKIPFCKAKKKGVKSRRTKSKICKIMVSINL